MATNIQDSTCLPLQETIVLNNNKARSIELVILSLLVSILIYRVIYFKDQDHYILWLLAFLCESWFTFNWLLLVCIKWDQHTMKTYPDRLLKSVSESEFPAVDIFVTTADLVLEPPIITMNTVLSLLAVDYPADKLALYLSDDGCSPLIFYFLVETTKYAKLWVPFCKKYNVQVRAPFRYFNSTPLEDDSVEFQQEWKNMKNEYEELYKKIDTAVQSQRPFPFDHDSDFSVFYGVHRSEHPTIIKVVSENKERNPTDLPHVIYISREKSPKHHHHYKAGALNVLTRVSGVMTNAPLMLNVDCDMYVNNPQVFFHAMCMVFGIKDEENCAFYQFVQAFYDGLKDDPFLNQMANFFYIATGMASIQGILYLGTNCFHRRRVIYGSSPKTPNDTIIYDNNNNEYLHKILGKSKELRDSAAEILSESDSKIENRSNPSNLIEAAMHVASCDYEYGTSWGTQVGWLYGSSTEDNLTGLNIHGRGWRSAITLPDPLPFLGCAPPTYPASLTQQKRWVTGYLENFFTDKNPLLLTIKGKLLFRQALGYFWLCLRSICSIPELCYASIPAYCIITDSHFLPKVNEQAFLLFMGVVVIYNLYVLWELKRLGASLHRWWNLQRMGRAYTMTAGLFGLSSVMLKLIGLSNVVFEVSKKEHKSNDDAIENDGRFTFDNSPVIVPGVVILLVNLTTLVIAMLRLFKVDYRDKGIEVLELGLGEMFCCICLLLCFWEFLKGLFGNERYGIPVSTICKSGALALLFMQLCRMSSQSF